MSPQNVNVNSATGIVGPTGAGKSSLIATAAEYGWETYQKVTLLYSASGGGFPAKVQSLVRLGIIRLWRMRTRGEAFETCMRASLGWWPERIDPHTGETAPGVKLIPPITQRFQMSCPKGHVVKVVPFASLLTPQLCPAPGCGTHVTRENMQVEKTTFRTPGFEHAGVVAYDDLTSMLQWQMDDMASRHARQEIKGEDSALGGRITSGELTLGGNNRSHYGFVQTRAGEMVHNTLSIPGLVLPPLWTMLLMETTDEGGLPVKGPKLAGKAKTDEAPSWFGNMLEVGVVKDGEGHDVRRLSLNEFVDDGGIRHLIKHRGSPNMPPYLEDPYGQPWSQVNLGVFFSLLEKDIQDSATESAARYQNAPGLPEGEMTYGAAQVTTPAAAAPAGKPAAPAAPRVAPRAATKPAPPKPRTIAAPEPATPVEAPAPAAEAVAETPAAAATSAEPEFPMEPGPVTLPAAAAPAAPAPAPPRVVPPTAPRPPVAARSAIAPPPGPRPPTAPRRPMAAPARPATPAPSPVPVGAGTE